MRTRALGLGLLLLPVWSASVACGGSEDTVLTAPSSAAGAGGGTAGGAQGGSTAAGQAGASAGKGGSGAGQAGAPGGAAGQGGAGGGGKAGSSGKAGAGQGGAAGQAGASGQAGSAGGATCKSANDCTAPLPVTLPAGCVEWTCEATTGACTLRARDKDADGHRGAACKAQDGTPILTGDDCDDNDKATHPGGWDGPQDGASPDACDGRDQDCNGTADDGKTAAGKSCFCTPGDTLTCGEDGGGKTISFPKLDASGKPVGKCKLGKKTCGSDGKWGACVGTVPPDKLDICNGGVDDDCDGKADLEDDVTPPNLVTWSYDGDGDGYVDKSDPTVKTQACDDAAPTVCPTGVPGCNLAKWKLGSLPAKDCDDKDGDVNPAGVELCDGVDNDCNGTIDDDYANNASLWYFDWDGDNYGDINTTPRRSCSPPTTFPDGCATLSANVPVDYCAGVAGEGNPPTCPVPACTTSMWKKNLPNTDCKDRPDLAQGGVLKGNDPKLVYPGATDLCNGRDYNCDGSPNTGCGCSPVGSETTCGSDATCNLAKQVCVTGGTWDTSACLPDKARVDYCPDDDSDGYCDLSNCLTDVCPGGFPADGHKYRERTACLGFSTPNLGGRDCSDDPAADADAKDINPGLVAEVCNGDGKDHNCNGKSNAVGAGDCDCVNGGPVACKAPGHEYPVAPPPDTYPYAADPAMSGICVWDHKSCINGKWTACSGGTGAYVDAGGLIAEQCNGDGLDHDCDGKANTVASECSCQPGDKEVCGYTGTEVGICKRGYRDCVAGTFANSPCLGAVQPQARDCQSSQDNDCDGFADNKLDTFCECPYGATGVTCNAHAQDGVGTCKAGTKSCTYSAVTKKTTWSACSGDVAPNPNAEACGPAATDVGCDGKNGNGPGCLQKLYYGVQAESTWTGFPGPREYMLMSTTVEGPFTGIYQSWAYAKQPVGTDNRHFRRCYYCSGGYCRHMVAISSSSATTATCVSGANAEGISGWLLTVSAPRHTKTRWFFGDKPPGWLVGYNSYAFVPMNINGTPTTPAEYVTNWQVYLNIAQTPSWVDYQYDYDPNLMMARDSGLWAPDP